VIGLHPRSVATNVVDFCASTRRASPRDRDGEIDAILKQVEAAGLVDLGEPGWRHWRSQDRRRQNGHVNGLTDKENLVGDKGPGSKSGGKKPKGGPKPGDKKKR
jgi:hypothetical protein